MSVNLAFDILARENVSAAFDKISGKLEDNADDFDGWAVAVGAAGVAAGGALAAGLYEAMDVDAANDKLAAQLGAGAVESERLGRIAGDVYSGAWGESLEQVNDTIRAITQRIGEGNDEWLTSTSTSILDLSATFGAESEEIASAVGVLLNTGLFESSEQALDAITKGYQGGADAGGAFLDTLIQSGPNLKAFGFDGATSIGLIQQGLDAGAESADTVTGMFEELVGNAADVEDFSETVSLLGLDGATMAADLAAGGERAQGALDLLLDSLRTTEDPLARNAAVAQLFGEEGSALQGVLMGLDPSQATARLGEFAGATEAMGTTLNDNAQTNITTFTRSMQTGFVDLVGGKVLPVVDDVTSALAVGLGPTVQSVTGWMSEHETAVGTVAVVLGTAAGVIGLVTVATSTWAAAQTVLNIVLAANPIGIVVLALVALAAGFVYAYQHSETFRNVVQAAVGGVGDRITGMWDRANAVFGWLRGGWNDVSGFFERAPGRIGAALGRMWDPLWSGFRGVQNRIIGGWNDLSFTIGGGEFMGVDIPKVTISTPNLPMLATGGTAVRAGLAIVGEKGPELLSMPVGASVIPLPRGTSAGVGGPAVHIEHWHAAGETPDETAEALLWKMRGGGG